MKQFIKKLMHSHTFNSLYGLSLSVPEHNLRNIANRT